MALARHKSDGLNNLSNVTLVKERELPKDLHTEDWIAEHLRGQWELAHPEDLKEAFDSAGIELKVLLRKKIPEKGTTLP